jgi:hypothetical protein
MYIIYNTKNDDLRSILIYGPTLILLFLNKKFFISYVLAILHGIGHQIFQFIDENGMNNSHISTPDITIHTLMLLQSYYLLEYYPEKTMYLTYFQGFCFIGMLLNIYTSYNFPNNHKYFEITSLFSVLSVAWFIFTHIFFTTIYNPYYYYIFTLSIFANMANLVWIKFYRFDTLGDMFKHRYFESLFCVATWLLPLK